MHHKRQRENFHLRFEKRAELQRGVLERQKKFKKINILELPTKSYQIKFLKTRLSIQLDATTLRKH
jgi:hypothetical protein